MIYSLTSVYAWKCGTCTEVVPTLGKSPLSSSLKQTLPFFNSSQETSSTLLILEVFTSFVWARGGPNSHCFLWGLKLCSPRLCLLCVYRPVKWSLTPDWSLDGLKGTLRVDHFQSLQDWKSSAFSSPYRNFCRS